MDTRQVPPAQASARQTEMGFSFDRVLFAALDALEESKIPYCIIGGIAASGLGRPRSTHDIDFFVRPEDAEAALEALARKGFETERTDPRWLFKGWMEQMMVDVIFKSEGDIYFDDEMARQIRPLEYHGRKIPAVSPEDFLIIKVAVHSEEGPHHWHDALAVLSHASLDWQYLLQRARRAPRRLLSLMIYAQSNDIWIPNQVIADLYASIFNESALLHGRTAKSEFELRTQMQAPVPGKALQEKSISTSESKAPIDAYFIQRIRQAIATDERTGTLDIKVFVSGDSITARGEVQGELQRVAIEQVIVEAAPGFAVDNQVKCSELTAPEGVEEVV